MYDVGSTAPHQNRSIGRVLEYMSDNNINLSSLNWGGSRYTDNEGGIMER